MGISPGSGHRPLTLEWGNLLSDQPLTAEHVAGARQGRVYEYLLNQSKLYEV